MANERYRCFSLQTGPRTIVFGSGRNREEGREALRQAALDVIVQRFPRLTRLAKKQVAVVEDPELLRHVLVKVSVMQTAEEARQQLLALNEAEE